MLPPDDDDLTTLSDEQLSDALAALEAAELVARTRDVDMGASAAWYADRLDWPVFPLKPHGKQPLTRHGFKDATTDLQQIEAWWSQWPDANIGTPTGRDGCGYDVVDIDGPDGLRAWHDLKHAQCQPGCSTEAFCDAPGPFDVRARAFTPGGPGRHLYIPATGRGNSARMFGVSIDFRGAGGFVVIPPSLGANSRRYSWITRPPLPGLEAAA